MFKRRSRIAAFIVAFLGPALSGLWAAFPHAADHRTAALGFSACIAALALLASYFTYLKPAADLEHGLRVFLDVAGNAVLARSKRKGARATRMNIMVPYRPARYLFLKKRLRIVWGLRMENQPDVKFECAATAGVAGAALESGRPALAGGSDLSGAVYGFGKRERLLTSHIQAIYSVPIYEVDAKGEQTGRTIGVVNLDSTDKDAMDVFQEHSTELERVLTGFAETVSKMI